MTILAAPRCDDLGDRAQATWRAQIAHVVESHRTRLVCAIGTEALRLRK